MKPKILWFCRIGMLIVPFSGLLGWGLDIPIWTEGTVRCFDADYAADGTMFVAFQPKAGSEIRFYESRDRGYSWKELYRYECYYPVNKVKILVDDNTKSLIVFYRSPDDSKLLSGLLTCFYFNWEDARTRTTGLAGLIHAVSKKRVIENSFDACIWDGVIYAAWEEDFDASTKILRTAKATLTTLHSWTDCMERIVPWSSPAGTRVSIDSGPASYVQVAYASWSPETGHAIHVVHSNDGGSVWETLHSYVSSIPMYDPNVALAGPIGPFASWTAFNTDRGSHEIGLHVLTVSSLEPPSDVLIADLGNVDEYIADIEKDRTSGTGEANLLYIEDSEGNYRKLFWMQTSATDPLNWQCKTLVNDEDVTPWPEDVAPKLVYSPGAWQPGAGAVFSYMGQNGLYFDAPWNVTSGILLIVTTRNFLPALAPLIEWKTNTGIQTYVVETDTLLPEIDSAHAIKKIIHWYYQNRGVRYVMLFGDSEIIPTRYTLMGYEKDEFFDSDYLTRASWRWDWCGGGAFDNRMLTFLPNFFATDLYYADLYDGNGLFQTWDSNENGYFGEIYFDYINADNLDLIPDIAVGRVPVSNLMEAQNYVHKVLEYEAKAFQTHWFKEAFCIANTDWSSWVNQTAKTADILRNADFNVTFLTHSPSENADNVIRTHTPKGFGILLYNGHGPGAIGLDSDWKVCHEMLPVVFHGGCGAGEFAPNNLPHKGYVDKNGVRYCGYARDGCTGGVSFPRICGGAPPIPDPLQPLDHDGMHAEFLLCKSPDRGAILFFGSNTGMQSPGEDHGTWFFEAFTKGYRLAGDMWKYSVNSYYTAHFLPSLPAPALRTDTSFPEAISVWKWEIPAFFHQIMKYTFFGDPTLRVGGIPSSGYVTVVDETNRISPFRISLTGCYPNPFNAGTTLVYSLATRCRVDLAVYSIKGRLVERLADSFMDPGVYTVRWYPENLGSGVYLCVLNAGGNHFTKRLVYVK